MIINRIINLLFSILVIFAMQTAFVNDSSAQAQVAKSSSEKLMNPNNELGLSYADNKITKSIALLNQNKIAESQNAITSILEWLNSATEYHTTLYKTLVKIPDAKYQADVERNLALKFALLRDKAYYQEAMIAIRKKDYAKAVEDLVNVIQSEPKTKLGFDAYEKLQQIGFTYKLQLNKSQVEEQTVNPN